MPRRFARFTSPLALALLLFVNGRGALAVACAKHGLGAVAAQAPPAAPAAADHAGHHQAAEAPAEPSHDAHDGPCDCLDHCGTCPTGLLAAGASRHTIVTAVVPDRVAATTLGVAPARARHLLPFATAPPASV